MGKRSRKRGIPERSGGDGASASATTRAERDAARERRAQALASGEAPGARRTASARRRAVTGKTSFEDRPPAPWGSFPLVEIVVLIALVLLVGSFFVDSSRRGPMLLGGLAIGSLAGLELSIREHFHGFRSHSALLAGFVAAIAITITYFAAKDSAAGLAMVPVGGVVFIVAFYLFRQAFARRSGGVGFRR
jgi:uncharacterized membrane protein